MLHETKARLASLRSRSTASVTSSAAAPARRPVISFPSTPTWAGIQRMVIWFPSLHWASAASITALACHWTAGAPLVRLNPPNRRLGVGEDGVSTSRLTSLQKGQGLEEREQLRIDDLLIFPQVEASSCPPGCPRAWVVNLFSPWVRASPGVRCVGLLPPDRCSPDFLVSQPRLARLDCVSPVLPPLRYPQRHLLLYPPFWENSLPRLPLLLYRVTWGVMGHSKQSLAEGRLLSLKDLLRTVVAPRSGHESMGEASLSAIEQDPRRGGLALCHDDTERCGSESSKCRSAIALMH